MVREVSIIDGPVGRKNFMKNVRYYRTAIEVCLQIVGKKRDKHEAKQQGYKQKRHETKMKERAKIQPLLFNLPSTSFSLKEVENTKSLKRAKTKKRFTQLSLF